MEQLYALLPVLMAFGIGMLLISLGASFTGMMIAKRNQRDARPWFWPCFLFPPLVLLLLYINHREKQRQKHQ